MFLSTLSAEGPNVPSPTVDRLIVRGVLPKTVFVKSIVPGANDADDCLPQRTGSAVVGVQNGDVRLAVRRNGDQEAENEGRENN